MDWEIYRLRLSCDLVDDYLKLYRQLGLKFDPRMDDDERFGIALIATMNLIKEKGLLK